MRRLGFSVSLLSFLLVASLSAETSVFGFGADAPSEAAPGAASAPGLMELLGPPVDPRLVAVGADWQAGHEAYMGRVRANAGRARFAPVGELHPARPLLVIVPGHGGTFADLAGLAQLQDGHSLLVAVYDPKERQLEAAGKLAEALAELAPALVAELGPGATAPLRVVAHSYGATVTPLALHQLVESGRWGQGGLGPEATLVLMDGPWRGVDVPWALRLPLLGRVAGWVLRRNPVYRVDEGSQSTFNAAPSMRALEAFEPPPGVVVDMVSVRGNPERSERFRHWAPLNSWFPEELGKGELDALLGFLLSGEDDEDELRVWTIPLWNRKVGLRHLYRALALDKDFEARFARLREDMRDLVAGAGRPRSLGALQDLRSELAALYEEALGEVVDAFEGGHTEFMWEDPRFLPWLRGRLAEVGARRSRGGVALGI